MKEILFVWPDGTMSLGTIDTLADALKAAADGDDSKPVQLWAARGVGGCRPDLVKLDRGESVGPHFRVRRLADGETRCVYEVSVRFPDGETEYSGYSIDLRG